MVGTKWSLNEYKMTELGTKRLFPDGFFSYIESMGTKWPKLQMSGLAKVQNDL